MLSVYYDILGVNENASDEDIRNAFRKKAKIYHPDINKSPDAHGKFLLLATAYEILTNKEKKLYYQYNSGFTDKDPMQEYEDRKKTERDREAMEERLRYEAFLQEKEKLKSSVYYYPSMIYTYLTAAGGALFSLTILFSCIYLIYRTHLMFLFFFLPFVCGSIFLFKTTHDWFKQKKKYYQ